jgi:large subunit ribosomal protein L17
MASHRKLGRPTNERVAMLRNLTTSFLKYGKVRTTEMRAKEVKSIAERMITLAKRGDLHAKRQALSYLLDETVVTDLFTKIAPKYTERNGGYTRILRKGPRRGDAAEVVILELV